MNIVVENYMMTEEEASSKRCPYNNGSSRENHCRVNDCMSWVEARRKIERENHSGAEHIIRDEARSRNFQEVKRRGPNSSTGYLYLEAQGFCLRLWKNTL